MFQIESKAPLPEGWQWRKLSDICQIDKEQIVPSSSEGEDLIYLGLEHIEANTGRILSDIEFDKVASFGAAFKFNSQHVLYGRLRPYLNKVALPNFVGRCSTEIIPLLPKEGIDRHLLAHLLRHPSIVSIAVKYSTGGRMPRANMKKLLTETVPIPLSQEQQSSLAEELDEQLDHIAQMREAANRQLEAADAMTGALLREVFESEKTSRWTFKPLSALTTKIGSGQTPFGGRSVYLSDGIPLIRSMNVHNNRFVIHGLAYIPSEIDKEMSNSRVLPRDVLLNITGASIGRACVVPNHVCPANVNQHVSIIRPDPALLDSDFLSFTLTQPKFYQDIISSQAGATRQALTQGQIEEIEIPHPSRIEEQQKIANWLKERMRETERLSTQSERQLEAVNAMPAAVLREIFGEFSSFTAI